MTKANKEGQRKTPILRFKGFTDDWEQRELGKVAKIIGGGTPSTKFSEYWNGNINWFTPNEITSQIYFSESKRKISDLGLQESSAKLLPANKSILFTSRATIGEMGILTQDAATNQGFQSLVVNDENIPYFIFSMKSILRRQAIKKASGSTFLEISKKEVEKLKITIPFKDEQKMIGKLFKVLDNLLTLYENKRKLLMALFQGLLQYLFDFSKEKEVFQKSLSDIIYSETKGITKKDMLNPGNVEYLDTNRLNNGEIKLVSGKRDVDYRDIIILWDGSNAGKVYSGFSGVLGSTLKVFKINNEINSKYVYYYLKYKQDLIFHKFRTPNIPHVSKDFSQKFSLPIPDKSKQDLITSILQSNETQINFIDNKIQRLKLIKKSLLQNMFL